MWYVGPVGFDLSGRLRLTLPGRGGHRDDVAAEALAQYLEEVRPRYGPGSHPAVWLTERGGRISVRQIGTVRRAPRAGGAPG